MEIAIATARPATHQANTVNSLVPMHMREGAENFIGFLEDYYSYLNTDGLPSQEINNIVAEQDIDRTSAQYLDLIQREIAKNIPRAAAFDRVSLYKKIVKYYLTKGSEDSIINFFKIFYDDVISIQYPRERLFKLSSGDWDGVNYRDTKGFASNTDVIQDSYFWQDFSYVINSSISVLEWKNEFNNLVHPAGFKFFAILSLIIARRNNWIGRFVRFNYLTRKYESVLPDNYYDLYKTYHPSDLDWQKGLIPPQRGNYSDNVGDHMPMFQYGLLGYVTIVNLTLINELDEEAFTRLVILVMHILSNNQDDHFILTRNDYLKNLKFFDTDDFSEYKNTIIDYGRTFNYRDIQFPIVEELEAAQDRDDILEKENFENILLKITPGDDLYNYRRLFSNISCFITTIKSPSYLQTLSGIDIITLQGDSPTEIIVI